MALASLLVLAMIGGLMTGRGMARLGKTLASPSLANHQQATQNPWLLLSYTLRFSMAIGIVFLMTTKPDLTASLIAMLLFLGLGFLGFAIARRQCRPRREQASLS